MSYRQLTLDERYQIQTLRKQGQSAAAIGRALGRSRSTITREVARNSQYPGHRASFYGAHIAQQTVGERRKAKSRRERKIQHELQQLVEQKLRLAWSPEQISGRLWTECKIRLSPETIYQHVLRDSREQRGMLRYCLRFGGYKQHRFRQSTAAERTRARKRHIDDRPAAANQRTELGHWERDCVVGLVGGAALLTIVERKTRFSRIRRIARLTSDAAAAATIAALRDHTTITKSLTNDNGVEFGHDDRLEQQLDVPIYFCDPSSPWQRGSIENLNGLVRQFVPKRANIDVLHPQLPTALEDSLNHRPRKTLGFKTPHELMFKERTKLMSGPMVRLGLEFSERT